MVHAASPFSSFQKDGISLPAIKKIFECVGAKVSTSQEANAFAQKNLLLTEDQWHAHEETDMRKRLYANQQALLHELTSLHMIAEIKPTKQKYAYALVMGSFKDDVSQRLDFLARLFEQGYLFEHIVLLGGERLLRSFERDGLPENFTTEIQMMQYFCQQYQVFKNQQIMLLNAPMIQKSDGTLSRPTTDSTLTYFAQIAPKAGACLVISNNPYIPRQTKVAQRILDQSRFPTEGAGPAFKGDIDIVMVMDEFARRLYEECKQVHN